MLCFTQAPEGLAGIHELFTERLYHPNQRIGGAMNTVLHPSTLAAGGIYPNTMLECLRVAMVGRRGQATSTGQDKEHQET